MEIRRLASDEDITLPEKWSKFLGDQPETGMGYQTVTIKMADGSSLRGVHVHNGEFIQALPGLSKAEFHPDRIASIDVLKQGDDLCPVCRGIWKTQCRCPLNDRTCENHHTWHKCPVHKTVVVGGSDHSSGGKCSCGMSKEGTR